MSVNKHMSKIKTNRYIPQLVFNFYIGILFLCNLFETILSLMLVNSYSNNNCDSFNNNK